MGAVLAAVVHAPLASILILMEVTDKRDVVLPAMLACVVATGVARMVSRDSIYTLGLRSRGVVVGSGTDVSLLRRLTVDQVSLEPVRTVLLTAPLEQLFAELDDHEEDFVVVDADGRYAGLAVAEDVRTAMLQRDAAPHLLIEDFARPDLPTVKTTDDLAAVFERSAGTTSPGCRLCRRRRAGGRAHQPDGAHAAIPRDVVGAVVAVAGVASSPNGAEDVSPGRKPWDTKGQMERALKGRQTRTSVDVPVCRPFRARRLPLPTQGLASDRICRPLGIMRSSIVGSDPSTPPRPAGIPSAGRPSGP